MTSTLCQGAILGRFIAELFAIIVKTILLMVENVGKILPKPGVCWLVARNALPVPTGLDDVAGMMLLAGMGGREVFLSAAQCREKVIGFEESKGSQ